MASVDRGVQGDRAEAAVGPGVPGTEVRSLPDRPLVEAAARRAVPHRRVHSVPPEPFRSRSPQPRWSDWPRRRTPRHLPRSAPAGGRPTVPRRHRTQPRAAAHGLAGRPVPRRRGRGDRQASRRPDRIARRGALGCHLALIHGRHRPQNRWIHPGRRCPVRFQRIEAAEVPASSCAGRAAAASGCPARPPGYLVVPLAVHPCQLPASPSGHPRTTARGAAGVGDGAGYRPRVLDVRRVSGGGRRVRRFIGCGQASSPRRAIGCTVERGGRTHRRRSQTGSAQSVVRACGRRVVIRLHRWR